MPSTDDMVNDVHAVYLQDQAVIAILTSDGIFDLIDDVIDCTLAVMTSLIEYWVTGMIDASIA